MKRRAVILAALLALSGCKDMGSRLDRVAVLPPAPYDQGPTLSGHTTITLVDPEKLDATCRAVLANQPGVLLAPPNQHYNECYDPWNDTGYIPRFPSQAEQDRLTQHMLGHARGGTHNMGLGEGPWHDAPWKAWYKAQPIPAPPGTPMPPGNQ